MAHTGKIEYKDELGFKDLGPIVKSGGASPIEITCGLRMMNKSEAADAVSTIRLANILGRTKEGENLLAGAYNRMGKSIASGKLDKSFYEAQGHVLGVFDAMFAMAKAEKKKKNSDDEKEKSEDMEDKPVDEPKTDKTPSDDEPADEPEDETLDDGDDFDYGYEEIDAEDPEEYIPPEDVIADARTETANSLLSDGSRREQVMNILRRVADYIRQMFARKNSIVDEADAVSGDYGVIEKSGLSESCDDITALKYAIADMETYRKNMDLSPAFH